MKGLRLMVYCRWNCASLKIRLHHPSVSPSRRTTLTSRSRSERCVVDSDPICSSHPMGSLTGARIGKDVWSACSCSRFIGPNVLFRCFMFISSTYELKYRQGFGNISRTAKKGSELKRGLAVVILFEMSSQLRWSGTFTDVDHFRDVERRAGVFVQCDWPSGRSAPEGLSLLPFFLISLGPGLHKIFQPRRQRNLPKTCQRIADTSTIHLSRWLEEIRGTRLVRPTRRRWPTK